MADAAHEIVARLLRPHLGVYDAVAITEEIFDSLADAGFTIARTADEADTGEMTTKETPAEALLREIFTGGTITEESDQ